MKSQQKCVKLVGRAYTAHLTEGKQDPLEPSSRLVQTLFERFVQLNVEFTTFASLSAVPIHHVIPDLFKQDTLEENLDLGGFQVGDENLCTSISCVGCPCWRLGDGEELSPMRKRGKNFESSRKGPRLVPGEQDSDPTDVFISFHDPLANIRQEDSALTCCILPRPLGLAQLGGPAAHSYPHQLQVVVESLLLRELPKCQLQ